jgi:hypothetical protein
MSSQTGRQAQDIPCSDRERRAGAEEVAVKFAFQRTANFSIKTCLNMKPIRFTRHSIEQCAERGATQHEVIHAIRHGSREPAKLGRLLCRENFQYKADWNGHFYAIKQVAPVLLETKKEIVVITVYTFYF